MNPLLHALGWLHLSWGERVKVGQVEAFGGLGTNAPLGSPSSKVSVGFITVDF